MPAAKPYKRPYWYWRCPEEGCDWALIRRVNKGDTQEFAIRHLRVKHKVRVGEVEVKRWGVIRLV